MSTATAPKKELTEADLKALVGEKEIPLADLRRQLGEAGEVLLARAWAAGDIEFGRRAYCVSGPVGRDTSVLRVEDGWDWSGPKTKLHKPYARLALEKPPKTGKCLKYVRQYLAGKTDAGLEIWQDLPADDAGEGRELRWQPRAIDADAAHELIALHVRLTDKGLGRV